MSKHKQGGSIVAPDIFAISSEYVRTHITQPSDRQALLGHIRARAYKKIEELCTFRALHTESAHEYATYRQVSAFFSKNADLSVSTETRAAALATFVRAERMCRITNKRLRHYRENGSCPRVFASIYDYLPLIRKSLNKILGDPREFLDSIPGSLRVTNGATQDMKKASSQPFLKVGSRIRVPRYASPFVEAINSYYGLSFSVKEVYWNRVVTVPKNFKTDRTIAAEPTGLLPFQLCFDTYIKQRLLRFGIDLANGQDRHKRVAKQASIDGLHATIDLSMASDTLSFELVRTFVSDDWFNVLRRLRSTHYELDGDRQIYAKFSSMGNGVTFGLETAVFTAICMAVGSRSYLVYGDDIIVETDLVPPVIDLLRFLGFKTNEDKTFLKGPFRESCGGDYFLGVDVRPYFCKSLKSRRDLALLVNSLLARTDADGPFWDYLVGLAVRSRLPFGPVSDDLGSCVHMDAHSCYTNGLIHRSGWILYYKGIINSPFIQKRSVPHGYTRRMFDTFRYGHWCLEAQRRQGSDPVVSPPVVRGYREKLGRLHWVPSLATSPLHVYRVHDTAARLGWRP